VTERVGKGSGPQRVEIDMGELEDILKKALIAPLSPEDTQKLRSAMHTLGWVQDQLRHKDASIGRLRKQLFGAPSTEKTEKVLGDGGDAKAPEGGAEKSDEPPQAGSDDVEPASPPKGHGRHGADAYAGARRVNVAHETLQAGDPCPEANCEGKLYRLPEPRVLVSLVGQKPVEATVVEREALRCSLCGKVFVAGLPEGMHACKYAPSAVAMMGLLKYGSGMPFHRLEGLQGHLGVPLAAATQWELMKEAYQDLGPAYEELLRQAAQARVLHNDDTPMKILDHLEENKERRKRKERTGTFTTGIVAQDGKKRMALFFTGRRHAGENLTALLKEREAQRSPPIQMCDGLSHNVPEEPFKTLLGNCLAHGRRQFVDVAASFPEECKTVLLALQEVYHQDALARKANLSPEDRLRHHQKHSGPVMKRLREWMELQNRERKVEPNSALGEAIEYMRKRWEQLTLFLREPGAPLDNNAAERILKKAILHRKNSLFYKSENGAKVGDVFMSLIHTAEQNGVNPFEYLTALLSHPRTVAKNPDAWMPWTYRDTLAALNRRTG
jgi:transposase